MTPFKDKYGEALNGSELKNLCIKTTINITHHNPYAVPQQILKNKDISNLKVPPPGPETIKQATVESVELQQL